MHERNETWKKVFFSSVEAARGIKQFFNFHQTTTNIQVGSQVENGWLRSWISHELFDSNCVGVRERKLIFIAFICLFDSKSAYICVPYSDFRLKTINRKMFYGRIRARLPSVHVNSPGHNSFWKLKINLGTSHWRHSNSPQPPKKANYFSGIFDSIDLHMKKKTSEILKNIFHPLSPQLLTAGRWMDKKID